MQLHLGLQTKKYRRRFSDSARAVPHCLATWGGDRADRSYCGGMGSSDGRKKRKLATGDDGPDSSACIVEDVTAKIAVQLHPSSLLDVDLGVREHLNGLLLRFNEQLDGVPVAYRDVRQGLRAAVVSPYFPMCRVNVRASFTLIRPRVGAMVEGRVTEVTDTFIGMLLLNLVNVVIEVGNVSGFSYSLFDHRWKNVKDAGHGISHGDVVRCQVLGVQNHGSGYITISGGLGKGCGNVVFVKERKEKREKKREKKRDQRDENEEKKKEKKREKKREKKEKGKHRARCSG
jgi:hypothetical protein